MDNNHDFQNLGILVWSDPIRTKVIANSCYLYILYIYIYVHYIYYILHTTTYIHICALVQPLTDYQNVNVLQVSMLHNQTILAKSTLAAYFL